MLECRGSTTSLHRRLGHRTALRVPSGRRRPARALSAPRSGASASISACRSRSRWRGACSRRPADRPRRSRRQLRRRVGERHGRRRRRRQRAGRRFGQHLRAAAAQPAGPDRTERRRRRRRPGAAAAAADRRLGLDRAPPRASAAAFSFRRVDAALDAACARCRACAHRPSPRWPAAASRRPASAAWRWRSRS